MVLIRDGCSGDELNMLFSYLHFFKKETFKPVQYVDTECLLGVMRSLKSTKAAIFHSSHSFSVVTAVRNFFFYS